MKLKLITWNINFIHDNWYTRLININKKIKAESDTNNLIALQEASIPFSIKQNLYKNINKKYDFHPLFERSFIYKYINETFPKYKILIYETFNFFMDSLFHIYSYIFSNYGEFFKSLYFNNPVICACMIILFPFLAMGWIFIGLVTITDKNIKEPTKMKHIGHFAMIQYKEFLYNNKNIFFANIHLNPGDPNEKMMGTKKRIIEINNLLNFINEKKCDNIILAGDFNDTPDSEVYKILENAGFKSVNKTINDKEIHTFPSKNPTKCIDYIWVKGDNIKIKDFSCFGTEKESDHKCLKASLDIL